MFLLSVQLIYLYQLLGCKGPYLSSTNAGDYKSRLFEWVLVVAGRIYVSRFLSSDFLPLLWFISGIGDMEEGGSDCIAREGDNQNTFPLVLINSILKYHDIPRYPRIYTELWV